MEQHQHHHAAPLVQHQHHHASPLRPPVGVQDQHDQAAPHVRPPNPPIKVRLNSKCLECHVKLKNKLQKMSGVNDVDIAPEQGGTVTVSGSIDSRTLMEVIRNYYRRATLLCPFDQKEFEPSGGTFSKRKTCSASSSSSDDDDDSKDRQDDNIAVTNRDTDAVPSEPKEDQKTMNCCIMTCFGKMRCFGKTSKPAAKSPTPPPPRPSPVPEPKPPNGKPANFPRPGFLPGMAGMLLMPPPPPPPLPYGYSRKPPQPSPPYGYLGRPPAPSPPYGYLERLPLPSGYGNPFRRSASRSNPMVHYTSYTDNCRYP